MQEVVFVLLAFPKADRWQTDEIGCSVFLTLEHAQESAQSNADGEIDWQADGEGGSFANNLPDETLEIRRITVVDAATAMGTARPVVP
jgi:hypothetical protein